MQTLIQLLRRNHRMVLFVLLEIIALNWIASTHAHPRGSIASIGMRMSSSWSGTVGRMMHLKDLKKTNISLLMDNARLRTENLNLQRTNLPDTSHVTINKESWKSIPAEIIRYSTAFNNNILVANRGSSSGILPGMGMLDNGCIAGLVTEVTEHEALVLPIIHSNTQWSVRLGNEGAIGRLIWSGQGTRYATLKDIPLTELIIPGDPVFTTGFQGTFPSGLFVGKVEEVLVTRADKFQSVTVKLGADFKHIHYVEFLKNTSSEIVDSLLTLAPK